MLISSLFLSMLSAIEMIDTKSIDALYATTVYANHVSLPSLFRSCF
jgi:hypothetical protein